VVYWDELVRELPARLIQSIEGGQPAQIPVSGIVLDSRQVRAGRVFVALSGGTTDGHRFIPAAIEQGAAAIVGEQRLDVLSVPYLRVHDSRKALAYLSAAFYGFPARRLTVIGVTGTDGKTTTCNLIYHILRASGLPGGMISTVNAVIGDEVLDTGYHVTTPESPAVQQYLAQMVAASLSHVVLEATSHGLAQERVAACDFDIGVVTNITHEHLDYHGSLDAYRAAKARLFTGLANTAIKAHGNPRLAVLNRDDDSYAYLKTLIDQPEKKGKAVTGPTRIITYGMHPEAAVRAEGIVFSAQGLEFTAVWPTGSQSISTSLVGEYNLYNCLAAITTCVLGLGIQSTVAAAGIAAMPGIPGRMETIHLGQDFMAVVDFAHTPNALRNVLRVARQMLGADSKLIAVFGSAGLRDRAKRRLMAAISAELADITILTAEDPRTESLEAILAEMADELMAHGGVENETFWRIPDRGDALRQAVKLARSQDILMTLGKGHEQSMCFGEIEYPWDDRVALQAALAERLGAPGPVMPWLPTSGEREA